MQSTYDVISYPAADYPKQYKALIFSRWLRSLRFGNPLFKKASSDSYYQAYHTYIENLMAKPDSIVRLAIIKEDEEGPEVVIGFSVSREDVLDYLHVHKDNRQAGVGSSLMPQGITTVTHLTGDALAILENNPSYKLIQKPEDRLEGVRCFVFNPFA